MSTRTLFFSIILVLIAMGAVLTRVLLPHFQSSSAEQFVSLNDILGMAVVHEGLEYTLNFDQQNEAALLFNASTPQNQQAAVRQLESVPFEKIIFYLFQDQRMDIMPIGTINRELIFSAPAWLPNGYLQDSSKGALIDLLLSTYDTSHA